MVKEVGSIWARENHMWEHLKVGKYLAYLGKSEGPWCGVKVETASEAGKVNTG